MWSKKSALKVVAVVALPLAAGLYWTSVRDGLDGIEHVCLDELVKSPEMAGTTEFKIVRHYNWWENTYSISGFAGGAISRPYQDPRVEMQFQFKRDDGQLHQARVECRFSVVPGSGAPPNVELDRARVWGEDVFNTETRRWDLWRPEG
jgi:hypothetical protein